YHGDCGWAYDFGDADDDGALDHVVTCLNGAERKAYVILGPVSGTIDAADGTLAESSDDDSFGFAVTTVGDTDGDGTDDFAIGAPDSDDRAGAAFVVLGPDLVDADTDVASVATG